MRNLALGALLLLAASPALAAPGNDVDIKADDGTLLKATYHSPGKPGPAVLLFHQCNSQRKAWAGVASLLVAKGIHVLTIDYRGYGESGGVSQDKWTPAERTRITAEVWPKDLDRAYDFLVAQAGVDRKKIGAGGASCGVNNAIQLARRHPEDVIALVLLAGGTDDAGQRFLEASPWIPILASGAKDDNRIDEAMRWLLGFSSNPQNQLKVYDKGGHGTAMFAVHKDLEPAIAAWFQKYLVTRPAKPGGPAKPGPSAQLAAGLREPGGVAKLRADVKAGKKVGIPPENAVNIMAYGELQAGRVKEAIELFALNAEAHPDSANVWDSLSDAYLAAGDRAKAVEYAKKALEVLPRDKQADEATRKAIREAAEAKIRDAK